MEAELGRSKSEAERERRVRGVVGEGTGVVSIEEGRGLEVVPLDVGGL